MKKKKISQKSKRYFREAREMYYYFDSAEKSLETELDPENRKSIELVQQVPPWFAFYSIPAKHLVVLTLSVMGLIEGLNEAAKVKDPLEGVMRYFKELIDGKYDDDHEENMNELSDDERGVFYAMIFAMLGNINAMKAYHRPISKLLIDAETSETPMLQAISIDRSILSHPLVAKRISIAQILNDESFMQRLAKALTRTIPRGKHELDDFRYMAEIIEEKDGLSTYSYEDIAELFINDLDMYKEKNHGDGTAAIKKLLQRRAKAIGT